MLKKRVSLFLALIMLVCSYFVIPIQASEPAEKSIEEILEITTPLSDFEIDHNSVLISYNGNSKEVRIPDSVSVIGEYAFKDKDIEKLIIVPINLRGIYANALEGNPNLTIYGYVGNNSGNVLESFVSDFDIPFVSLGDFYIVDNVLKGCFIDKETVEIPDGVIDMDTGSFFMGDINWVGSNSEGTFFLGIVNPIEWTFFKIRTVILPESFRFFSLELDSVKGHVKVFIKGHSGSEAEQFAIYNGIGFINLDEDKTDPTEALTDEPTDEPIPTEKSIIRLSGKSRIDTANDIAVKGWEDGAETVILANGMNYADALAGGSLAYAYDAPILLTQNGAGLESSVLETIKELGAKNVLILGGISAVKEDIEIALDDEGYKIERIFGQSRYQTAIEIAKVLAKKTGVDTFSEVFIADGGNFPDALAASPVVAIKGVPILFTYSSKLTAGTEIEANTVKYIKKLGAETAYVLGGVNTISNSAMQDLGDTCKVDTVTRVSGASRYETAVEIYNAFSYVFKGKSVAFATGTSFPDALSGSAYAAKIGAPIFLVNENLEVEAISDAMEKLAPETAYIFGGKNAVSSKTVKNYFK